MKVILSSQDKFRFAMLRFRLFEKSRRTKREREREKKEARFSILVVPHTHTRWVRIVKNRGWLRGDPVRPPSHKGIINASQSRCGAERIASIKCNFGRVSDTKFWIAPPPRYFHLNGEDFRHEISKAREPEDPLFSQTTRRKNRPIFG